MAQTSVAQLATDLKMPAGTLLEQLQKAGVGKNTVDDVVSEQDKSRLLEYLRRSHGAGEGRTKITLTRRETSEIKAQDAHGKSHTVQVEVRKKRVLVKRDIAELRAGVAGTAPAAERPAAPAAEPVVEQAAIEAVVEPVVEKAVDVAPIPAAVSERVPEPAVEPAPAVEAPVEAVVEPVVEPAVEAAAKEAR